MTIYIHTARSYIKLASLSACLLLTLAACETGVADEGGETETETGETGTGETETGETETGETGDEMSLAIIGTYADEFGDTHMITADEWANAAGTFAITQWDNDGQWLIAQNGAANMYFPDMWSRFDWAWDSEQLYYCQSVYDGETAEDAQAGSAEPSDLAAGCGGFAWTMLTAP